jgi:hypothetical protein
MNGFYIIAGCQALIVCDFHTEAGKHARDNCGRRVVSIPPVDKRVQRGRTRDVGPVLERCRPHIGRSLIADSEAD